MQSVTRKRRGVDSARPTNTKPIRAGHSTTLVKLTAGPEPKLIKWAMPAQFKSCQEDDSQEAEHAPRYSCPENPIRHGCNGVVHECTFHCLVIDIEKSGNPTITHNLQPARPLHRHRSMPFGVRLNGRQALSRLDSVDWTATADLARGSGFLRCCTTPRDGHLNA